MKYHVEVEEMSRNPQIAACAIPVTIQSRMFEAPQDAVDFAREAVRDYAGLDLPRAFVRSHHEKGRRKGHSDPIFTVWRKPTGEIQERRVGKE